MALDLERLQGLVGETVKQIPSFQDTDQGIEDITAVVQEIAERLNPLAIYDGIAAILARITEALGGEAGAELLLVPNRELFELSLDSDDQGSVRVQVSCLLKGEIYPTIITSFKIAKGISRIPGRISEGYRESSLSMASLDEDMDNDSDDAREDDTPKTVYSTSISYTPGFIGITEIDAPTTAYVEAKLTVAIEARCRAISRAMAIRALS